MTLLLGFMIAESAAIGLLIGFVGSAISMITTWLPASPTFSRTQINLSDSIVRLAKPIFAGWIPAFVSYEKKAHQHLLK